MRFTTIFTALVGTSTVMALPGLTVNLSSAERTRASMVTRDDKPSKLWPKPLQDDWKCMKAAGVRYPDVHGDWSHKKEGIHTAWGFPSSCCRPFAKAWKEKEAAGETRGIHAEFTNTKKDKGADPEDCDHVVMSHIKRYHWPYLNRFWRDFGVVQGQDKDKGQKVKA